MNDLWVIAYGAGLRDGLNPCIFMTCAFFVLYGFWLAQHSLRAGGFRTIFALVYASSLLMFNFGPAQAFVLRKEFIFAAKILYLALGIWTFILGFLFLKDWLSFYRGQPDKNSVDIKIGSFKFTPVIASAVAVLLALFLSALATLAPVDNYIMLLGNEALLKGQWQEMIPLLAGYVFFSMWPLWFIWVFLSIKNLRPSLLKIVCASIFFTASSCVILMFN